ncbi:MAG: hypothetical protein U1E14_02385 [Geminicoccaceae bacterium]
MTGYEPDLDTNGPVPGEAQIREALQRALDSEAFAQSGRLRDLLRYLVEETLAGRGSRLKGYTLGVEVFGRGDDFDPQADSIVRVEVGRLRTRLVEYYAGEGRDEPVRIDLAKGTYAPLFRTVATTVSGVAEVVPEPARVPPPAAPGWRRRGIVGSLVLVLLAVALATFFVLRGSTAPSAEEIVARTGPLTGPRVLVQPFTDLGQTGEDAWFAAGLSEEIFTDLARFRGLTALSRPGTWSGGGRPVDVRVLRQELGIDYVVQGSVRRTADRLVVTAQLIDTDDASVLWASTYDKPLNVESILSVEGDIGRAVAAAVAGPSGPIIRAEIADRLRAPLGDLGALDCVIYAHDRRHEFSAERRERLRSCLAKAVKEEPDFAAAWALLALLNVEEYAFGLNVPVVGSLDAALEQAQRAVQLDPDMSLGWRALAAARFFTGDDELFREAAARALELNPANPDNLAQIGALMVFDGDWKPGTALVERALALNLGHTGWYHAPLFWAALHAGDYAGALRSANRMWLPEYYGVPLMRAAALGLLGNRDRAALELKDALQLFPEWPKLGPDRLQRLRLEPELIARFQEGLAAAGLPPVPPSS